jgi:hypothetical protein
MMEAMERALPRVEIGMYTGFYWFREHSNAVTNASQYAYLKERKLFEAFYTADVSRVLVPNPWTSMFLWQFGTPAVGSDYGVETAEIDMSYINMTEAEFRQKYDAGVVTPQPGETMAEYKIIWPNGANERKGPSVWDATTGTVYPAGAVIQVASVIVKRPGLEEWGVLANGYYVALIYESPRAVLVEPEPEPGPVTLKHTIDVYDDGSLRIDGRSFE